MNRTDKTEFIEEVRAELGNAPFLLLADFKGTTVQELDKVRRAVESAGASFRVVKNTLCRIAVDGTDKSALAPYFKGNIGVIVSGDDPIAAAKVARTVLKENAKLQVRAGFFEGDVLDARQADAIADLPSREELLSTLLATVEAAPRQVLQIIQAPARDLLYLLSNFASKLEEAGE